MQQDLEKLRIQPKAEMIGTRFTKEEARRIRQFCKAEKIQISQLVRYAIWQIVPNPQQKIKL